MKSSASVVLAVGLMLGGHSAFAQDLSRYRDYVLGTSLESIVAATGANSTDARTIHVRPAAIQELLWRAPYVAVGDLSADPVRDIAFSFYNDALYQVVVNYHRQRTEGLTNDDVIYALSVTYGPPAVASARNRADVPADAFTGGIVLARWQDAEALLTLVGAANTPEFQLIVTSKALAAQARSAIKEAARLDTVEAPQRERKDASDAATARENTRVANKAAFRP